MDKKYVLFPERVYSQFSGKIEYIGALDLVRFYEVNPAECIVISKFNRDKHDDDLEPLRVSRGLLLDLSRPTQLNR